MMVDDVPATTRARGPRRLWIGALVAALGGAALLYGLSTPGREGAGACAASAATIARLDPLIHGEVAALSAAAPARAMPALAFVDGSGTTKTLADFRGRTLLVNLWATWCVPCRKEMPALDTLQDKLGGPDFQVVAINVDTARLEKPRQFLRDVAATHLSFYADPTGAVLQTAKESGPVLGLPTTFLIDRNGCTLAALSGPADWASTDARALIEAAIVQ